MEEDLVLAFDPTKAGWVPPEERNEEQTLAHEAAVAEMAPPLIVGSYAKEEKVFLWEIAMKAWAGKHIPTLYQLTGSCVSQGAATVVNYTSAIERVRGGEPEEPIIVFPFYHYGLGRMVAGIRGRGEGSSGAAQAKAIERYGVIRVETPGLPPMKRYYTNTIGWDAKVEIAWSDGRQVPETFLSIGKSHLIRTTSICRNVDDVVMFLTNRFALTCASNWGGLMQCNVENGVLLNRRAGVWNHQMSILAFWDHPQLGLIFYIMNSWSEKAHGVCPTGAPLGGFWITAGEMASIVKQGETIAYSQFDGYPSVVEQGWSMV